MNLKLNELSGILQEIQSINCWKWVFLLFWNSANFAKNRRWFHRPFLSKIVIFERKFSNTVHFSIRNIVNMRFSPKSHDRFSTFLAIFGHVTFLNRIICWMEQTVCLILNTIDPHYLLHNFKSFVITLPIVPKLSWAIMAFYGPWNSQINQVEVQAFTVR